MEKLLIIDGNSIINRAFYAIRGLSAKDGRPTSGVYGFLNILLKFLQEERPSHACVAFDTSAPTFRHAQFSGYKATRKPMPSELALQMPILKEVLSLMNIEMLEKDGYEADDIIGTASKACADGGALCAVVTGDRDCLQLAGGGVKILLPTSAGGQTETKVFDAEAVFAEYGVTPEEFIEVKGLMGDSSDNIPGVSGIGEKTALSLISRFHSIENLYKNLDSADIKPRVLGLLQAGKESAFLSRQLAEIDTAAPVGFDFERCRIKEPDNEKLYEMFEELGFKSLIKRLGLAAREADEDSESEEEISTDVAAAKVAAAGGIDYIIEGGEIIFSSEAGLFKIRLEDFKDALEDEEIKKAGHGTKEDILCLSSKGISLSGVVFDTEIGAYLINPARSGYELSSLCEEYLNKSLKGPRAVRELKAALLEKLDEYGQRELYDEIENPLIRVLADMQRVGFKVDREGLVAFGEGLDGKIAEREGEIWRAAGEEFNINSPKQLGKVLFEDFGLAPVKKTKTGFSTDIDVLEKLRGEHPAIDYIIDYRHLTKLKSTYVDGLLALISPETGRIHSRFNQTVTTTGRISSTEPNMQNIPVRTPLGRELRRAFTAEGADWTLVDADYSQIELRVLAHISDDRVMKEAFRSGADIHALTAAEVFGVAPHMVTDEMRTRAKAVNFGIVYGIGDFSLARDIGATRGEARKYIDGYLATYSGVREFMQKTVESARELGYVATILNRRRYIPEIKSKSYPTRAFGERVAMNAPIQGSAADIIKVAMVGVHNALFGLGLKSRLILQVHDELIVETHAVEEAEVKKLLKEKMEGAFPLSVPLVAEVKAGKSWYDAK